MDFELLLSKLQAQFGIETLMLGGGGVLNWSFIQVGLCAEISVVIAPAADGASDSPALFETRGRTSDEARGFELLQVEAKGGGAVWLRYAVQNDPDAAHEPAGASNRE